ncbi:sensor histidine kinase regulating citrate/malate metabolism [Anaerotaenia torta]|uniref:sensor histidine kinase n=1 Tax=Anaerotaenia torta TaxID=433293 RepID=UPI003D1E8582
MKTEYLLRHLQKSHYEIMLAKEEETRSFRHDISNHIMCLGEITKTGNLTEATRYIEQMQTALSEIQKKSYITGNEILDAILSYNIYRLGDGVNIHIAGFCNGILDVSNVELCSILSNPLQNAVEALIRQQEGRKYLNIHMHSTPNNFQLEIQNSFDPEDNIMINGLPYTKKPDNKNHGIGLKNVKRLVEKNNGLFQLDIQPGEFNVLIILPMKECIC